MTTALLIIDVQHALCSGDGGAFESRRVIDRINQVSAKARAAGAPVILIQHEAPDDPLEYGTEGWKLADGLDTQPSDIRLRKKATDSFHNTELQALLQAHGIKQLIICGMQSDFCVDTTTRRALALGYPVTLVSDGHSTVDNGVLTAAQISAHHTVTLANIQSFGPRVTPQLAAEINITVCAALTSMLHATWMPIAFAEAGVRTFPMGQSNPRVTEYHAHTNIPGYDDKASWCSSFVNWSLAQAGIAGTGSALARSWLDWGEPLGEPVPGCIAVLSREDPGGWKGHVGFFLRADAEYVYLWGGNQLDEVREHFYPRAAVLSYRWPSQKTA